MDRIQGQAGVVTPADAVPRVEIPEETAYRSLTWWQWAAVLLLAAGFCQMVWLYLTSKTYLPFYVISSVYLIIISHKFALVLRGVFSNREVRVSEVEILSHRDWPVYTILLPIYREREIFPQLCRAVEYLDYPKDRLEVILLTEEDDEQMRSVLAQWVPPPWWKVITVPHSLPKTKGKALNFGLAVATGTYLVIYDAEDIPERDQLKKAVIGFERSPANVACLQAKLNYYNPEQNILTEWFTAEYSSWFDLYLPGIDSMSAPIPLGGTSNHFRTSVLKELKGWDPFNVTEDCDLGIRIFRRGYRTRVLDTTTWEEANSDLNNWIKQRSRWVKGYIQTYFVHMRNPLALLHRLGCINFLHFTLIVAGNFFVLCFNPVAWGLSVYWLASSRHLEFYLPNLFFQIVTPPLLIGNVLFVLINVLGVINRKYYRLILAALLSPVYWVLMSVGAWKGLWQYFFRPHYWEKTDHALFGVITETRSRTA